MIYEEPPPQSGLDHEGCAVVVCFCWKHEWSAGAKGRGKPFVPHCKMRVKEPVVWLYGSTRIRLAMWKNLSNRYKLDVAMGPCALRGFSPWTNRKFHLEVEMDLTQISETQCSQGNI